MKMPKCQCLVLDRNHGELFKKASWESSVITIKRGFRKEQLKGFIPDSARPIELHKRRGSIPLFILNRKTLKALTMKEAKTEIKTLKLKGNPSSDPKLSALVQLILTDKTDVDADTKLNLLTKKVFWKQVAEKLKLTKLDLLIYLCAGYGVIRIIEFGLLYMFASG